MMYWEGAMGVAMGEAKSLGFKSSILMVLAQSAVLAPLAVALYTRQDWPWPVYFIYLGIYWGILLKPFMAAYHQLVQHPIFPEHYSFLDDGVHWMLAPLFGVTPGSFPIQYGELYPARSGCQLSPLSPHAFRRGHWADLPRYLRQTTFNLSAWLTRLNERGRPDLANRLMAGELLYFILLGLLGFVNWKATLVVFWVPLFSWRWRLALRAWFAATR